MGLLGSGHEADPVLGSQTRNYSSGRAARSIRQPRKCTTGVKALVAVACPHSGACPGLPRVPPAGPVRRGGRPHSAFRTPHSAFRLLLSAFWTPHSALRTPHSAFRFPPSAFRFLPSACCFPPSAFPTPLSNTSAMISYRHMIVKLFYGPPAPAPACPNSGLPWVPPNVTYLAGGQPEAPAGARDYSPRSRPAGWDLGRPTSPAPAGAKERTGGDGSPLRTDN